MCSKEVEGYTGSSVATGKASLAGYVSAKESVEECPTTTHPSIFYTSFVPSYPFCSCLIVGVAEDLRVLMGGYCKY